MMSRSASPHLRLTFTAALVGSLGCNFYEDLLTEGDATTGTTHAGDSDHGSTTGTSASSSGGDAPTSPTTGGSVSVTGAASTTDDTTDGDTTTADPNCPMDHAHLEPLWATKATFNGDLEMLTGPFGSLSDGRIVVTTYAETLGKLRWFSGDGEELGSSTAMGPLSLSLFRYRARVAADDSVIAVGGNAEVQNQLFVSRTPPNGPEPEPVALADTLANYADFRVHGNGVVVIGQHPLTARPYLLRADIATGATTWDRQLGQAGVETERGLALALGSGDDLIAGYGFWSPTAPPVYKVWRVVGAPLWEANLPTVAQETGWLADLVVAPDGTILAVTQHELPEPRVSVTALASADGAVLWTTEIAITDENGPPMVEEALVLGDALVIPIGRVPDYFNHFEPGPLAAELVRLSFTGDVLEAAPLPLGGLTLGDPWFNVARGPCDTLLLFHADAARPWLYAFAP